jgi:histidinol-phosphatase
VTGGLDDLTLAHRLADAADRVTRGYFGRADLDVEKKGDGSPVTLADRGAEEAMAALVAEHRPTDGVLGEEVGEHLGGAGRRWIFDGIDGTHNFAAGRLEWGTLIALEVDGEITTGVVASPGMGRRWWAARGRGTWVAPYRGEGLGPARRLAVTTTADLDIASVHCVPPVASGRATGWRLAAAQAVERWPVVTTAFGHSSLRVAEGRSDAAVHLAGGPWDNAVGAVLVEEAGGRFSDAWGGRRVDTGTGIYSNAALFEVIREAVTSRSGQPE